MEFLTSIAVGTWQIVAEVGLVFYESSVFILLGFALAGVLHEFIPMQLVARRLGKPGFKSIFWATALGAPLPLCSCGVLPTAAALRRKGASKPAVASFIVSVPETGVDSIAVSYGLMGPVMAIFRPIVAVVTAFVAGVACLFITRDEDDDLDDDALKELEAHDHDHDDHAHGSVAKRKSSGVRNGKPTRLRKLRQRLGRMAGYGFRTVLDEVAFWIVVGLVVTGVLMAFLPDDFFSSSLGLDSGIVPMLLMAVVGIPLYTCASMSTPIAAGLIASGLSPGAALVFLLAGPATSIASLSIVGKLLGRRSMIAYLGSILVVAICAGLLLDSFAADQIRATTVATFEAPDAPLEQAFKVLCTLVFLALFVDSLTRKSYREPIRDIREQGRLMKQGVLHVRRIAVGGVATLLVAAVLPFVTLQVGPGEQGMIIRFGAVVEQSLAPGLYWHFPWPVDETRLTQVSEIREVSISAQTSEYLTSDENVIALTSVIQYRIRDAYAYEFHGDQNVDLLRELASRVLVQEILARPIDEIYTTERSAVEATYRSRLRDEIDELGFGFELIEARLEHVHAPEEVHNSFRDVSSALEDRQRALFVAEGSAIANVTNARGVYDETVEVAEGDAKARVLVATGKATAFLPHAEQIRRHSDVGRYRLRYEAIDRSLVGPRKFLSIVPGTDSVDLWIDPTRDDALKFNFRE